MTNGFPTTGAIPMINGVRMTKALSSAAARVVAASLAIALLAACGGTSTANTPTPSAASSAAASAAGASAGTKVGVTEKEFSITLDRTSFSPGTYSFAIQNQGRYAHNLKISGPGVTSAGSSVMAGGQSGSLTVTLQKGTYQLWCGVPGHKDKGMLTSITVA
jgi:uncharacterized cupredoxin-like copper-binding protein